MKAARPRVSRHAWVAAALVAVGCGAKTGIEAELGPAPATDGGSGPVARASRFVGLWVVDQPFHALYEATVYRFEEDGRLGVVDTSCGGHLERHGVTGSVARCVPTPSEGWCEAEPTCLFGAAWQSSGASTLIVAGECSDGRPREIRLAFDDDPTDDDRAGGARVTLESVGGERGWSHDNFEWAFRRCPAGTDAAACAGLDGPCPPR